jgi:hypothetical protein
MPDYFIKFPRPESIHFFEQAMRSHDKVESIKKLSDSYYLKLPTRLSNEKPYKQ